ncbi:DUF2188 domain-containing protein [Muricoccus pecuniae]|uniref:DUF2188 domain-containing protein n=1 Tax=Muricoccus pecuniae TaxID=693023 RepID=UPI00160974B7
MTQMTYYVLEDGSGWKIRHDGNDYTGYSTKAAAVRAAISTATRWVRNGHNADVQVQGPDGACKAEWPNEPDPFAALG